MLKTALAVLFLCLFAVFSIALKTELRREKSPVAALKIGEPMPDFELPDPTGKTVKLSEVSRDKKIGVGMGSALEFRSCSKVNLQFPSQIAFLARSDAMADPADMAKFKAHWQSHALGTVSAGELPPRPARAKF